MYYQQSLQIILNDDLQTREVKSCLLVACVAWQFKQFEREHTKRRSRENEQQGEEPVVSLPGSSRLRFSLLRFSRFPIALKLLKSLLVSGIVTSPLIYLNGELQL